jgi:hypothetical protein
VLEKLTVIQLVMTGPQFVYEGYNTQPNNVIILNMVHIFRNNSEVKYLGKEVKKYIHEEIKSRIDFGNARYHSVYNLSSSSILSKILFAVYGPMGLKLRLFLLGKDSD